MQTVTRNPPATLLSPAMRVFLGAMVISAVLFIIAGAVSVPFYFESSSMLYKFGADKTLLRTGKVLGLIAACLVLLQSVLSARFKSLDRIFASNNLMNVHRTIGMVIAGCVLMHPALIFLPEDRTTIPISFRFWPEYAGLFLLVTILGIVLVAIFRQKIGLSFDRWRMMHQWGAFAAAIALFVHVLSVSESFESGLPRIFVFAAIGCYALIFLRVRIKPVLIRKNAYTVSSADLSGRDAYRIRITPDSGNIPPYLPGQFAFISIKSVHISAEWHPFTIASSPSQTGHLEFVIRTCGDWTRGIGRVRVGDRAFVEGPFGLFTHLRCPKNPEIIMIAGGIGITPMLSMLRFMADAQATQKITLVWSNRTRDHVVFAEEFDLLKKKLPGLRVFHVFTNEPTEHNTDGRLDQAGLKNLLADCDRKSCIFLCGPPQMMTDIGSALHLLGFPRRRVLTERFSL